MVQFVGTIILNWWILENWSLILNIKNTYQCSVLEAIIILLFHCGGEGIVEDFYVCVLTKEKILPTKGIFMGVDGVMVIIVLVVFGIMVYRGRGDEEDSKKNPPRIPEWVKRTGAFDQKPSSWPKGVDGQNVIVPPPPGIAGIEAVPGTPPPGTPPPGTPPPGTPTPGVDGDIILGDTEVGRILGGK
jgi:hypothetical protein